MLSLSIDCNHPFFTLVFPQVWILLVPPSSTPTTRAPCPGMTPSLWTSCTPTPEAPQTAASASRDPWATLTFTPTEAPSSLAATSRTHCWGSPWKASRASKVRSPQHLRFQFTGCKKCGLYCTALGHTGSKD